MTNEPYKWELNPDATLRELGRMEDDPGYRTTICGIHRMLWAMINIDANGHIPEDLLDRINDLLETAYRMGKRMDYRLHEYHKRDHGDQEANLNAIFVDEVSFPMKQMEEEIRTLRKDLGILQNKYLLLRKRRG
jgi:hypothetical protein